MAGEVEDWVRERELHPGTYAVGDWNFETPKEPVIASALTQEKNQKKGYARFEIFDYPTEHSNLGEGEARAKLRMEIEEVAAVRSFGRTSCATLTGGHRFTLKGHYRKGYDREYLLTSVQHSITQGVGFGADEGGSYSNSFTCIPHSVVFRPPLLTPKPVIQGVQTALVVGKQGEEIDVDKYGRVALQFHWDRRGKRDDKSSCRIRVSQPFAGKGFGGAFWPRIGQEVIVSFEEGDPDRPLVTGRVYNAEQMPPFAPASDMKTQSGIRTRSSKSGSADNFNEIRFEDKKGEEHIFVHAEKDQHNHVKDAAFEYVGGEHHRIVKKDDYLELAMNHHRTVATDVYDDVGGSLHQSVGMDRHTKVGMVEAVESGMEIHLKGGMNVVIEAGMQLTLKGAGGFIVIDPSGVTVQGTLVRINSGGAAGSGKGAKPKKPKKPKEAKKT
jgi:type VI secretion system secreted protein VgrG